MGLAAFAAMSCLAWGLPASAQASSSPVIESEAVSHITATDATLEAQINPGGLETTYEVWVGRYPECTEERAQSCESSGNGPAGTGAIVGTIPASFSSHTVSVDIAKAWHKLSPNSSYIYSVSATNSGWAYEGSAYGENKVFKTAAASPPSIESVSVSHVTPTDATLEATLNTEGLETTYEFQLIWHLCPPGTEPLGCTAMIQGVPLPSGKLFGSFVGQSISLELNSAGVALYPHSEYDYRVVASNAAGSAQEPPRQTFITPEDGVQPLNNTPSPSPQPTTGPAQNAGQGAVTPAATNPNPVGNVTPSPKVTVLTSAQKLGKAVKACKRKPRKQRAGCVKQAKKKYGTTGTKAKRG
jgi:hypothetical protein